VKLGKAMRDKIETMMSVARLQAYLRHSAQQQYETVSVPFFTLFFHPADTLTYFNYAIPEEPCSGDLEASLAMLRNEFVARGRRPRIEFIQEFAPRLAPALGAAGFVEEACHQLMVCTAETYRVAPEVAGLRITQLTRASTVSEIQDYLTIQRRGFDVQDLRAATEEEAEQFQRMMGGGKAFVARLEGQPGGVGMYTAPYEGATEVVGLATLEPFRRRGIASAVTAMAVQEALQEGAEVVCLTAADERAGRVYERVGFVRYGTMLAYIDASSAQQPVYVSKA
jgi:GNAT superfamily N-acetyltransferase